MPRVSEQYLDDRRAEILAAAARCFAANGFHASSMADVIAESGRSAGAVYRYFRSKDEIVGAVAARVLVSADAGFTALLADHRTPSPVDAVALLLTNIEAQAADDGMPGVDLTRLVVQVWAEALRNPQLGELVSGTLTQIRGHFIDVARRWQEAGHLPADAAPEQVAAAMLAMAQGFLVQRLLVGESAPPFLDGIRALLTDPTRDARGHDGDL